MSDMPTKWGPMRRMRTTTVALSAITLAACSGGLAPEGDAADRILDVTVVLTVVGVVVCAATLGAWAWAIRRPGIAEDDGFDRTTSHFAAGSVERRLVLGGGIVMPAVVMVALFGFGVWNMGGQSQQGDFEVEVIGHQFWWEVVYHDAPGAPGVFTTANEIHVPVGTEITFRMSSDDVIHSFSVPELSGKVDLVPGRENRLTFAAETPGTYEGFCAEFCGLQHAWMKFEVVATEPAEFATWAAAQADPGRAPSTDLQVRGREVFLSNSCVGCHAISGVADTGRIGPDLTHLASRDEIGAGLLSLDEANLTDWVANAQALKGGSRMPPQQLSDEDMDAVIAYLLSLE